MSGDPYSRLYHRFEREYPDIYRDDRTYALWCRLLPLADATWPMKPPLPRSVYRVALQKLVDAGLVVVDGDRYEIRGMAKERMRRSQSASNAATARWADATRNADGNATRNAPRMRPASDARMPRRDETRKDETRRDEGVVDPVMAYMRLTGSGRPSEYAEKKLRANAERYGQDAWLFAVNAARELYGTKNDIRNAESIAEERYLAAKAEAEAARKAALPKVTPEQARARREQTSSLIKDWISSKEGAA